MALARCNFAVQDRAGNIVDGASVEVRRESDNVLISVYSDRAGSTPLGNPYTASNGADAGFYAAGEAYKITVTHPTFGTRTWRHQPVGLQQEEDEAAGTIGGSTGATDNRLLRSDGTDGATVQASAITVDDSGHITAFGGNITFPATQAASADANTLDDYEEGTWTPGLTFATPGNLSVTYSRQVGEYTKIGRVVFAWFDVRTSAFTHTTASGDYHLTGLPFEVKTVTNLNFRGGGVVWGGITKANYTDPNVTAAGGGTFAGVSISGSGQPAANVTFSDVPSGGTPLLASSVSYEA